MTRTLNNKCVNCNPQHLSLNHISGIVTGLLMTQGPLNFLLTGETPAFFEGGVRNQRTWGSGVASGGSGGSGGRPAARSSTANVNTE